MAQKVLISWQRSNLNWGTLNGRRRLFTTGDGFGRAGLLAQRAALVSCDTKEKVRSGLEVVRKTFLIFDFNPEGCGRGVVGIGVTWYSLRKDYVFQTKEIRLGEGWIHCATYLSL